jgi:pseudouridine-5'-phosphate glycosidase
VPATEQINQIEMAPFIQTALADADQQGIVGKAVTPFLLQRIFDLTEGRSLTANIALVRSNARLAAEIAREINTLI